MQMESALQKPIQNKQYIVSHGSIFILFFYLWFQQYLEWLSLHYSFIYGSNNTLCRIFILFFYLWLWPNVYSDCIWLLLLLWDTMVIGLWFERSFTKLWPLCLNHFVSFNFKSFHNHSLPPFHWPKKKSTEKANKFPFYQFYGWINYTQWRMYRGGRWAMAPPPFH